MSDVGALQRVGMELIPGDEADAVAAAAAAGDSRVRVERQPAIVLLEAPGRLRIDAALVREHLGRDWAVDDLQVIMASYFGFISRWDDDGVALEWISADDG